MKLALGLYLLLMQTCVWATAIAVIWTPNGAIFGADAKLVTGEGKDAGTTCKIGQISNNILFAEAGILRVRIVGIDFMSIISGALASDGTLDQRIAKVESAVVPVLTNIVNAPLIRPGLLERIRTDHRTEGLQVAIVAFDGDRSRAIVRNFLAAPDEAARIKIKIERDGCPGGPTCASSQLFSFGQHEEMDAARTNPEIWKTTPAETIQRLLTIASNAHPESVGPPFSVAIINKNTISWPVPGACNKQ